MKLKKKILTLIAIAFLLPIFFQRCGTAEWSEEGVIKMINNPQKEDIYFVKEDDHQFSTYKLKAFNEDYRTFVVNKKITKTSTKAITLGREDKDFDMTDPVRYSKEELIQWAKDKKIEGIERRDK